MNKDAYTVVGTRPPRYDAPEKVTGQARYAPDIKLPGMLYGKILRSPHAHARIQSIDTSRAEALEGVHAIVTAADLPDVGEDDLNLKFAYDNTPASDKVLYTGHAIAAVAARTPTIAEQALALVEVEYEVLPPVLDVRAAMAEDAPLLHEQLFTRSLAGPSERPSNVASHFRHLKGDPEAGFAEAAVVVERVFRSATVHQGYLEPQAATATWQHNGGLTIHTTTQGSFAVRDHVARLLRLPLSQIRVIPTEVGGAFGGKNTSYVDVVAALLSRKAGGRPVRVVMTRAEVFLGTGPTPGTEIHVKLGATRDGKLTAAQATLYYEAGAYPGSPVGSGANVLFAPYDIPNGQIDGYDVVVNKPHSASYRAPGATPASFAGEQVIDELAAELEMDPIEFRMRNCAREGTVQLPGGQHGSVGGVEVLQATREHPHYSAPLEGENRARGMAFAFWGNWGARSSCTLSVNGDGTVNLLTSSVDITGTRTSLAMQAAETLGLPLEHIKPSVGDSSDLGYADVSAGSRTTMATGIAVVKAAQDIIAQLSQRAALLWDVTEEDIHFEDGVFSDKTAPGQQFTFAELAAQQSETGGYITGVGNVNVQEWGGAFGAHIVDLELDRETGEVTLLRYTAVQDAGRAIHPTQVEGQIQGGAVQGIGWALYEGYVYDEAGHMLNPTLLDYKLPTALDLPPIDTVIVEVPYPKHPYGVRGVGEVPIMPPPAAIANALCRITGERLTDLPMTPANILHSLGLI